MCLMVRGPVRIARQLGNKWLRIFHRSLVGVVAGQLSAKWLKDKGLHWIAKEITSAESVGYQSAGHGGSTRERGQCLVLLLSPHAVGSGPMKKRHSTHSYGVDWI